LTKIVDDIDMNVVKEVTKRDELLRKLAKEFHTITDGASFNKKAKSLIDGMNGAIEVWKDAAKLGLTAEQIKVHTKVVNQIASLEKSITATSTPVTKALHSAEIASLKKFAVELKTLPVQEVENMLELSKTLKMSKMAKLVES
jgi:hypothetical protein